MRVRCVRASRARGVGGAVALVAGLTALAGACREPTQVTLDITYRGPCTDVRGIALLVGTDPHVVEQRVDGNVFTTSIGNETCTNGINGAPSRIGTLVVTPRDGGGRTSIIVLASFGDKAVDTCERVEGYFGCIVARRVVSFVENTKLELGISLDPECRNVPCDAVSTCRKGACVDSFVDCSSGTCMTPGDPGDGGIIVLDGPPTSSDAVVQADAPKDGLVGDGPADAPVDAADASDAAVCVARANIKCKYPGAAPPVDCDLPTEGCCWGSGIAVDEPGVPGPAPLKNPVPVGAGYRCSPISGATCMAVNNTNPPVLCLGAANCAAGEICCARGAGMLVQCTTGTCNGDGGGGFGQACLADCECPSRICGNTSTVGVDPAQTIRYCSVP